MYVHTLNLVSFNKCEYLELKYTCKKSNKMTSAPVSLRGKHAKIRLDTCIGFT